MIEKVVKNLQRRGYLLQKQYCSASLREDMRKIESFCISEKLPIIPKLRTHLPFFHDDVLAYIQAKAKDDIPKYQHSYEIPRRNLSDLVEIGGVLGINTNEIDEISYSPPDTINVERRIIAPTGAEMPERIWLELYGGGYAQRLIVSATSSIPFCPNKVTNAKFVVDWHTHPSGSSAISKGDAKYIAEAQSKYERADVLFAVYVPRDKRLTWYESVKAE
jgi:hypothetical protein